MIIYIIEIFDLRYALADRPESLSTVSYTLKNRRKHAREARPLLSCAGVRGYLSGDYRRRPRHARAAGTDVSGD